MSIPYISTKEAAQHLGVSEQRVRTLLRDGLLQGERIGKSWVVGQESVTAYAKAQARKYPQDRATVMKQKTKLKALSFFSGALGLDLGLEQAGIDIALACEVDKRCRETIIANKPDIGLLGDISAYSCDDILAAAKLKKSEVDVMVGGPPCQAFSTAGTRRGFHDARGNIFLKYIDLILQIRPRYAVIENVRGLLSAPLTHRPHALRDDSPLQIDELPGGALMHIIDVLEQGGYGISFNLYNAANYGVPQIRERVVMLCHREGEKLPYLCPTHAQDGAYGLKPWVSLKDVIGDLVRKKAEFVTFPERRLKYYRLLKEGQYWKHLPEDLQKEAMGKAYYSGGGKTGFLRRLAWARPSCTLVTSPAMPATDICHPTLHRPLSVQEYKRIQQFPDDWIVCGSISDQYRQIGNAVPVGLGRAIGAAIIAHMQGVQSEPPQDFPFSRYHGNDDTAWRARILSGLRQQSLLREAA